MNTAFNSLTFIAKLLALSPRQGVGEQAAAELIRTTLRQWQLPYTEQVFATTVPYHEQAQLLVDGEEVSCKNTSFVGGVVEGVSSLHSSLIPSRYLLEVPNINFNPHCNSISRSNYYFAPSVAVAAQDVMRLISARNVRVQTQVSRYEFEAANILVGNSKDPTTILIAHYDSIEVGATDNAAGVATLLAIAIAQPEILEQVLLVFSGNEELSYDQPTYWGHGFRAFEEEYERQLAAARSIIIVDVVGNGAPVLERNDGLAYLAFPITHLAVWQEKILLCYADVPKLLRVYHSAEDIIEQLDAESLQQALTLLLDYIRGE